jgi:hypothetical protein
MPEKSGGGCLKALLITAGLVCFAGLLLVGMCAYIVKTAPTPPPTTLSAQEQRFGKIEYCPGSGLKGLGFSRIREAPPCPVEMYLARSLKDPSSYQGVGKRACDVSAGDKAWLVDCTYRAKNSFGALVVHTQRFHVLNGAVVKVEDAR